MTYGSTFTALRDGAGDVWPAYTQHAFVKGLGDGGLSRDCFLHYLVQDYVFLIHFSRAWALAVTKADTVEEMQQSRQGASVGGKVAAPAREAG